jgi:hypothetical protein
MKLMRPAVRKRPGKAAMIAGRDYGRVTAIAEIP